MSSHPLHDNGHVYWYKSFESSQLSISGDSNSQYQSQGWQFKYMLHRDDGPAIELRDGHREWWLNGQELTEKEFDQWLMKKNLNEKLQSALQPKPTQKRSKI